jgi:hypothetical protein
MSMDKELGRLSKGEFVMYSLVKAKGKVLHVLN